MDRPILLPCSGRCCRPDKAGPAVAGPNRSRWFLGHADEAYVHRPLSAALGVALRLVLNLLPLPQFVEDGVPHPRGVKEDILAAGLLDEPKAAVTNKLLDGASAQRYLLLTVTTGLLVFSTAWTASRRGPPITHSVYGRSGNG